MKQSSGRRRFLKSVIAMGATGLPAVGLSREAQAQQAAHATHLAQARPGTPAGAQARAYLFLTAPEIAFVEAACARLIPADELGPGAKEAGVAYFIDQQLAGAWGAHARNYRLGPWPEGTPQQGYQSPLTPKEVYRTAIAETNHYCNVKHGKTFDELATAQQEEVLGDLEAGKVALELVPARLFFNMLWANTREGFFADPMYGGNRDKIGWKLVGFPGVAAVYTEHIEKYNQPYRVVPVSIADIQQRHARVDEHGHPVHKLLSKNE